MARRKRYKLIVQTQFSRMVNSFESKSAALAERKSIRDSFKRKGLARGVSYSIEEE